MISSRQHPVVQDLLHVRDGKRKDLLFAEGPRLAWDALNSGLTVTAACVSDSVQKGKHAELCRKLQTKAKDFHVLSQTVMGVVSDVETPQGIVLLVERPASPERLEWTAQGLFVAVSGIQIPANVGAVLRAAEAAGATGAWCAQGSADPFSPKVLRGSSGSAFRLPIVSGLTVAQITERLVRARVRIVSADPHHGVRYTEYDWRKPTALFLGAEGPGFAEKIPNSEPVRIPMAGKIESLNVATAAAVLLFEARRQRTAS